ncbi:chaperone NapD [Shewanella sp. AS1]|uniref:chaperone NapD n=1 Tax=Shewanella sp. AS1 TaxID=2907626 RepID=UPI001F2A165A|nr:chaperone NapD [Shewanella sp. AS1]MCE9679296.1 chaperone NapD [Shewanella sp. AS1]
MNQEYHVSSLVIHASPSAITAIQNELESLPGAEIHAVTQEGKFIVTLEGATQGAILSNIEAINAIKGVLSSSLVYHQVESEEESEEHNEH